MKRIGANEAINKIKFQLKFKKMTQHATDWHQLHGCLNCNNHIPKEIYHLGFACKKYKEFPKNYCMVISEQKMKPEHFPNGSIHYDVIDCSLFDPVRIYNLYGRDIGMSYVKHYKVCRRFNLK